jgi:hypothetical protein
MKRQLYLPGLIVLLFLASCQKKATYLSSLNAGKDFPLYTTYAAAQERSDFILDEGYEFKYDQDSLGADFTTDTGGDICIGFRMNGKWVYRVADMHQPPVITSSYPDLVKYRFEPFENIQVDAVFMTYSSRMALADYKITNLGNQEAEVEVFPFMRSNRRGFHQLSVDQEKSIFEFSHEEYPDSWTLGHQLPYADSLRNIVMLSSDVDETLAFSSEKGESPIYPSAIYLERKPTRRLSGRLYAPTGERLLGSSPVNRLQLIVDDNFDQMVTENSSVWGTSQTVFEPGGYFMIEGGMINPNAKTYRLTGYNVKSGLQATVSGNFTTNAARCDLKLSESNIPVVETVHIENNRISWTSPDSETLFSVYRRCYPEDIYHRVAREIKTPEFTDSSVEPGKVYGYVVVCSKNGVSGIHSEEVINVPNSSFSEFVNQDKSPEELPEVARVISFRKKIALSAGNSENLKLVRSVYPKNESRDTALAGTNELLQKDVAPFIQANEDLLQKVKTFPFRNEKQEALFWSNVNMMRQVFYPPQAKSDYNYYVFSREPTWGWGHGGQVFHESITMLAYADVDPLGAMNSQRVYRQRQYPNGYINYRTGSFLDEIIEENGELTSSAPWYSYLNWEVYQMTRDKAFLKEMYDSSVRFYNFYTTNRDKDGDGLCEWGGEAILESVRDALVAVWDQVGYPSNFEGLDLNCMLVMEAKSLEAMALELGLNDEAKKWKDDYEKRTNLINKYCWDPETGFYYQVNKTDHSFTFKTKNDLKRMEIIGFLPLWAGVANKEQAASLVGHLTDPEKFWRKYGIPSLAADDPYYNDKGYWNGPVWVQWNYLIERGLLDYGYPKEAAELVDKVTEVMYDRLSKDHNLWEFYSPDTLWGGHHKTYIWTGIVNRMMKDVEGTN